MAQSTLTIASYNVNGIRAAMKKDFASWLSNSDIDIIGLQETKAQPDQVDISSLVELGYTHNHWFSAEKKGYSGVAIFSKVKPDHVSNGIGHALFDSEGRVQRMDIGDLTILNCYFPSGTSGDIRQDAKYQFLDSFYTWVNTLRQERPNLIIQGDYNIAHTEMDIHNPKSNKNTSGFLPEERAWMTKWLTEGGFNDSFRMQHPDLQKYSWWSYRAGARAKNKGWRIDYQCISQPLSENILQAELLNDAVHSDHCPCLIKIKR